MAFFPETAKLANGISSKVLRLPKLNSSSSSSAVGGRIRTGYGGEAGACVDPEIRMGRDGVGALSSWSTASFSSSIGMHLC